MLRPRSSCQTPDAAYAGRKNGPQISYCRTCTCSWSRAAASFASLTPMIAWPNVIASKRTRSGMPAENSAAPRTMRTFPPSGSTASPRTSPISVFGLAHAYAARRDARPPGVTPLPSDMNGDAVFLQQLYQLRNFRRARGNLPVHGGEHLRGESALAGELEHVA